MPEVRISIGGRDFDVACQEGEEHYLRTAAEMLDAEASVLVDQIGRMPEARMLLMAGLMLADKTAGMNDKVKRLESELGEPRARMEEFEAPGAAPIPLRGDETDGALEAVAERAEAIATALEAKVDAA